MKEHVKEFLQTKLDANAVIAEVGAHYGEDTVGFLSSLNPSHIYCFEPDPRNIAIFKKYVRAANITLFEFAASNENCNDSEFYLSYKPDVKSKMFNKYHWIDKKDYLNLKLNASGASSLKKGGPEETLDTVKVKVKRLDTWAWENNIEHIDFMWIDVQGAEREVIEGLGEFINNVGCIWMEFGERSYEGYMTRQQTIHLLSSKNFVVDEVHSDAKKIGDLLFWKKK